MLPSSIDYALRTIFGSYTLGLTQCSTHYFLVLVIFFSPPVLQTYNLTKSWCFLQVQN